MPIRSTVIFCLLFTGCQTLESAAPAIILPAAREIDAIKVTPNFGDVRDPVRITDRVKIEQFVEFVNSRDTGWKQPWDTFPLGQYTVLVERNGEPVAVFWPSADHIGGRGQAEDAASNRLHTLTNEDWQLLRRILDIREPAGSE